MNDTEMVLACKGIALCLRKYMVAVSNKKGTVGSKGRNMPIMPSMSEVVPTMVYSIFIDANIDQKTKKCCVLFILFFFMVYLCVL